MWNHSFTPPTIIEAEIWSVLPPELERHEASDWSKANKAGQIVTSFLEGPCFDREGNLYLTDIPHGRILKVDRQQRWTLVAETGGWPNGIALDREGQLWVTDYARGLLRIDPTNGSIETVLGHRNSESFKGINDLVFDRHGNLYFTDQGQSGLHDPSGRVYRFEIASGRLTQLLSNVPSPNGIALDPHEKFLFVAATRGNNVWRMPLLEDGSVSKAGAFQTFFGTSGPDGLAVSENGDVLVAHASLGGVFVLDGQGWCTHFIRSPRGGTVTNVAFVPGEAAVVCTESASGVLLRAQLSFQGKPLYSHQS